MLTSEADVVFLTNSIESAMILTLSPPFVGCVAFAAGFSLIVGLKSFVTGDINPLYNKVFLSENVF